VCEFTMFEPSSRLLTSWATDRYSSAFGSPVARVQGIGYIKELVARLTHTPIKTHDSSTNATLDDNPITFPLGQSLYVDATHEVVVLNSRFFFFQ
jgi:3D (Asp-Asp-Asp) domain-containing protein